MASAASFKVFLAKIHSDFEVEMCAAALKMKEMLMHKLGKSRALSKHVDEDAVTAVIPRVPHPSLSYVCCEGLQPTQGEDTRELREQSEHIRDVLRAEHGTSDSTAACSAASCIFLQLNWRRSSCYRAEETRHRARGRSQSVADVSAPSRCAARLYGKGALPSARGSPGLRGARRSPAQSDPHGDTGQEESAVRAAGESERCVAESTRVVIGTAKCETRYMTCMHQLSTDLALM